MHDGNAFWEWFMVENGRDICWMCSEGFGWSEDVEYEWKSVHAFGGGVTWNVFKSIMVSVVGFKQVDALTFDLEFSMPATRKVKKYNGSIKKKHTIRGSRTVNGVLTPLSSESQLSTFQQNEMTGWVCIVNQALCVTLWFCKSSSTFTTISFSALPTSTVYW